MNIRYCESCGTRLPNLESASSPHVDRCEKCLQAAVVSTDTPRIFPSRKPSDVRLPDTDARKIQADADRSAPSPGSTRRRSSRRSAPGPVGETSSRRVLHPTSQTRSPKLVTVGFCIIILFAAAAILISLPRGNEERQADDPEPVPAPAATVTGTPACNSNGTPIGPVNSMSNPLPSVAATTAGHSSDTRTGPSNSTPNPPAVPASTAVSLELHVSWMNDTAEEKVSTGEVNVKSTDLELVMEHELQVVGIRFGNATIPPRATIQKAYIQFTVDEKRNENPAELIFAGEATDNAALFTTASRNVSSRPCTTAQVTWEPVKWTVDDEAGPAQRTPDLRSILQEIVNRPGWVSGNHLAFIVKGSGKRVAKSYVSNEQGGPVLHVIYEKAPDGTAQPR